MERNVSLSLFFQPPSHISFRLALICLLARLPHGVWPLSHVRLALTCLLAGAQWPGAYASNPNGIASQQGYSYPPEVKGALLALLEVSW